MGSSGAWNARGGLVDRGASKIADPHADRSHWWARAVRMNDIRYEDALAATQRTANDALNSLSQAVQTLRDEAQRTTDRVTDRTSGLIRHDPLKAVLIAAATGAALMALAGWLGRSHHNR